MRINTWESQSEQLLKSGTDNAQGIGKQTKQNKKEKKKKKEKEKKIDLHFSRKEEAESTGMCAPGTRHKCCHADCSQQPPASPGSRHPAPREHTCNLKAERRCPLTWYSIVPWRHFGVTHHVPDTFHRYSLARCDKVIVQALLTREDGGIRGMVLK